MCRWKNCVPGTHSNWGHTGCTGDVPWRSQFRHGTPGLPVHSGFGDEAELAAADARQTLIAAGLAPEPQQQPGGPARPRTSWLTDPDGYRIELVQWPPGHADGLSAADFT